MPPETPATDTPSLQSIVGKTVSHVSWEMSGPNQSMVLAILFTDMSGIWIKPGPDGTERVTPMLESPHGNHKVIGLKA